MVVLQKLQGTLSSKKCWLTDHGYQDTPARPTEQPMLMTERVLRGERGVGAGVVGRTSVSAPSFSFPRILVRCSCVGFVLLRVLVIGTLSFVCGTT